MAFVCTLSSQASLAPVISANSSRATLVYPIGYDDVDHCDYQLFVGFNRAPGAIVEYSFCIVCIHNNGVVHDFWDSKVVAHMIPSKDRQLIRALLLNATTQLIEGMGFPEVTMHTFAADLPAKALVKYRFIAQLFISKGYRVREATRHGQQIWWFERGEEKPRTKRRSRRRGRRR